MSATGQPTSVHSEKGVVPAAFSCAASVSSCSHVVGGAEMPAAVNSAGLYKMVFLFAPLNQTPYCLPLKLASVFHAAPKFDVRPPRTLVRSLMDPAFARLSSVPGSGTSATSGGEPPDTAAVRAVSMLLPLPW